MKPDYQSVALNYGDQNIYPLVWQGYEYAVYFEGGSQAKIKLHIANGKWQVNWINPSDLNSLSSEVFVNEKGTLELIGPEYEEDALLYVHRADKK